MCKKKKEKFHKCLKLIDPFCRITILNYGVLRVESSSTVTPMRWGPAKRGKLMENYFWFLFGIIHKWKVLKKSLNRSEKEGAARKIGKI